MPDIKEALRLCYNTKARYQDEGKSFSGDLCLKFHCKAYIMT